MTSSVQNGGPPHDFDAEVGLLGSILLGPDAIRRVRDLVDADDFYRENNGTIFQAALNLLEEGEPIDPTTIGGELARLGVLDRVGGRAHLWQLREVVPTAAIAKHSARMVRELARLRRVGAQALEAAKAAHDRTALDALGDHIDLLRETATRLREPSLILAQARTPVAEAWSDELEGMTRVPLEELGSIFSAARTALGALQNGRWRAATVLDRSTRTSSC